MQTRWGELLPFPAGPAADYAFPAEATIAFITIGRNKYAGLTAGKDFSCASAQPVVLRKGFLLHSMVR